MLRPGSRDFWLAQLAVWGAFGVLTYLTSLGGLEPGTRFAMAVFKGLIRPALGILASTMLVLGYRRWLAGRAIPGRLAVPLVVVACAVMSAAWLLASVTVFRPFNPYGGPVVVAQLPRAGLEYLFALLAWSTAYFWLRSRYHARESEQQAFRAEAAARSAQLELLTEQLNPHFLFNALASVRGLIREDPTRAEIVVGKLADFLRRILARPATGISSLTAEVEFARAYLGVEESRHGGGLDVIVDVTGAVGDAAIPVFLLHPLVENAVKHGQTVEDGPRRVLIRAEMEGCRLRVEVVNKGSLAIRPVGPGADTPGTGLHNLRRRLAQYASGRHDFRLVEESGEVRAILYVDQAALALPGPEPVEAVEDSRV